MIDFDAIFKIYQSKIFFYIYKSINKRELAEDLTQIVFINFSKHKENIKDNNKISSWLFKSAKNEVYQHLRKQKGIKEIPFEVELQADLNIPNNIENKELIEIIDNELEKISHEQREVFILREYSGLSYKEISELLLIDIELVKSRLYMTRQYLLKKLSKII